MKKILTSLALIIVFVMLFAVTAAAFTTSVLSNPTYQKNIDGINYVETTVKENGSTQKIFYGEYNTTSEDSKYEWVIHSVRDGSDTTLTTVMNIAKDYEQSTGRKVMLAVNGDYFYNTGANVDSYVNNGIVVSKGNMATKHCIGFDNEGKVVIGRMTETDTRLVIYDAEGNPQFFKIDKFNSQPAEGEIAIYNTAGTHTVTNAGAMVVKAESSNLTSYPVWGSDYTMTATGVQGTKTFTLKSGQYAVVYTAEHNDIFKSHVYGQRVDLVEVPAGQFAGCTWVVGGYDAIVDNYVVNTNCHTDNSGNSAAPRTFVGFKADGTGFVCVVDGRGAGGSAGITVNQEAQLASVLGAQYALELDGGGSSTMVVRIGDTLTLRNTPSDGSMRKVSNAVLLVEKPEPEHECEHVCDTCGKCLDSGCAESVCADKCQGHVPPHACESVCETCGKCLNTQCTESVCADKCQGHVPPHSCESICEICEKCLDLQCTEDACIEKCAGHIPPHQCESVCETCGKCLDGECTEDVCAEKCEGHDPATPEDGPSDDKTETPDKIEDTQTPSEPTTPEVPEEPKDNSFGAWIRSIIEAIRKFFMNLFS